MVCIVDKNPSNARSCGIVKGAISHGGCTDGPPPLDLIFIIYGHAANNTYCSLNRRHYCPDCAKMVKDIIKTG